MSSFLDRRTSARAHLDTAARDLDLLRSMGGRLVTPDDDEWPRWRLLAFDALGSGRDDGAPLALWVLGDRSVDEWRRGRSRWWVTARPAPTGSM